MGNGGLTIGLSQLPRQWERLQKGLKLGGGATKGLIYTVYHYSSRPLLVWLVTMHCNAAWRAHYHMLL